MVMERLLRKFNGNPVTKKKYNSSPHGSYPLYTFGAPLKDVIDRDKSEIPLIVTNVFDFLINHRGLEAEGVFRVNGNSRTVDILKHLIDENGSHWPLSELSEMATELERSVDVYSVASLLKLYLRELPDGLIPARVTPSFLEVFQGNKEDKQKCLYQLERLIGRLPVANYTLLQHLCQFLHTVWTHREVNKMSVEALGIVFGPNVFQLHRDSEGIHEQGAVNRIMTLLIENSGYFFRMTAPSFANVTSDIVATDRLLHPISDVKNLKKSSSDWQSLNGWSHSASSTTDSLSQSTTVGVDGNTRRMLSHEVPFDSSSLANHQSNISPSIDSPTANEFSASLAAAIRVCIEEHVFRHRNLGTFPTSSQIEDVNIPQFGDAVDTSKGLPVSNALNSSDSYVCSPDSVGPRVETNDVLYLLTQRLRRIKLCIRNRERELENSWGRKLCQAEKRSDPQLRELLDEIGEVRSSIQQAKLSPSKQLSLKEYSRPQSVQADYGRQSSGNFPSNGTADYMSRSLLPGSDLSSSVLLASPVHRRSLDQLAPLSTQGAETGGAFDQPKAHFVPESHWSLEHNAMLVNPTCGPSPSNAHLTKPERGICGSEASLSETYAVLVHRLAEKRCSANRPEALHLMTPKQIEAEKLAIQKALLYFESLHGRPKTRQERLVMRPLYDRYRAVKRLLAASRSAVDDTQADGSRGSAFVAVVDGPLTPPDGEPSPRCSNLHSNGIMSQSGFNGLSAEQDFTCEVRHGGLRSSSDCACREVSTPNTALRRVSLIASRDATDLQSRAPASLELQPVTQTDVIRVANNSADHSIAASSGTFIGSNRWSSLPRDSGSSSALTDLGAGEWFGSFRPVTKYGIPKADRRIDRPDKPPCPNPRIFPEAPKELGNGSPHKQPRSPKLAWHTDVDSSAYFHAKYDVANVDADNAQVGPTNEHKSNHQRLVHNRRTISSPSEQISAHTLSNRDANLSDWSVTTLESELQTVRENKRMLQKTLKDFEHQFERATGHKVERCDRLCMRAEYNQYKTLKSRLIILERELSERMS